MLNKVSSLYEQAILKGHETMRSVFRFFCINLLGTGPLYNCSSLCDFGLEFAEIFEAKSQRLLHLGFSFRVRFSHRFSNQALVILLLTIEKF
jgi:hypothetical protein